MENIIVTIFEEEGEAYKAFSAVRNDLVSSACKITQLALVERKDGRIAKRDFLDSGIETTDDLGKGALIGGLVGLLIGPISLLIGTAVGAAIGANKDEKDAENSMSLIERVSSNLQEGEIALIALAYEDNEDAFNIKMSPYKAEIIRYSAEVVASEIKAARELTEKLAKEAKERMREVEKQEKKLKKEIKKAEKSAKI